MSFEEQERAMFDLLFDTNLRDKFCRDKNAALTGFQLDIDELNDFSEIRADALVLDAQMRVNLVLSQLCRAYPITFSITSSFKDGSKILSDLVDTRTMRTPPMERTTLFGTRLRECLFANNIGTANEQKFIVAILEAELGMAITGAALKRVVLESGHAPHDDVEIKTDWTKLPVTLAAHVSAAIIPMSYVKLKSALCPVADSKLWRHLGSSPTPATRVSASLRNPQAKLLVTRATIDHMSLCDPTVSYSTLELSDGFAPLFQYINGTTCVDDLLAQLKQAGATDQLCAGVQSGFKQLLENGMLLANQAC